MRQRPVGGADRPTPWGLTAVLTATTLLLAACGGAAEDDGQVVLRFSWWGNDERVAMTNEAIEAFERAHPGIRVEGESIDFEAYFDRLATSVAAGDGPDVITMGGAYPREYADRGVLLDLAEVSDHLDLGTLDETALANGEFDGKVYGVPTGVNTFGVIANPAVFEEAGTDLPDDDTWDWDDYVEISEEISAATPDGTFGSEDPTQPDTLDVYASQTTGSGLYTHEGGVALEPDTLLRWFEMTSALVESGGTPPADTTVEQTAQGAPEQSLLGTGQAGMKFAWSNQLGAFQEGAGADLVLLRAPGETTAQGTGMWLQASQLYTISADTDHPEEAALLVDFLVNDTEAADSIGSDRGIPANADLRAHLEGALTDVEAVEFAFVDRMSELVDGDLVIGPTGSTESVNLLRRVNENVLFGRQSPQEGAQQFVDDLTDAVS